MTDLDQLKSHPSVLRACNRCGEEKPATTEFFYTHSTSCGGLHTTCKSCLKKQQQEYTKKNKTKVRERNRKATKKWYTKNKKRSQNAAEHWRKNHPDLDFFYTYGISMLVFQDMVRSQNNSCKICKNSFPDRKSQRIDHDHRCCNHRGKKLCGKCVRGVLCQNCNAALGFFKDNPQILLAAIQYLNEYEIRKGVQCQSI